MPKLHALARENTGPLAGVRIVDLTSVVFGSYATQILGDQGADVIKVEFAAGGGDITRYAGHPPKHAPPDLGPIFMTINRNKRSVVLDLREDAAKKTLHRLIRSADVFAASVRMDGLARLGLDYVGVRAIREDIVYVHGAGYGADGPYAGDPAYDDLIQSQSGFADLLPRTDGDPTPRILPSLVADKASGLFMAQAITAALFHRLKTGEGQFVEVPMFECMTSFNLVEHFHDHVYDPPTGQWGYSRVVNPNRKPFRTKDGYIGMLPYTDAQWAHFFTVAGFGDTHGKDPRFTTYSARVDHIREVYAVIDAITPSKTTQEWLDLLKPLSIPVARLNRLDDLPADPHLTAVGLFEGYDHPEVGRYTAMRPPVRFSETPSNIRRHPPRLGEHTAEIEAELGEDADA